MRQRDKISELSELYKEYLITLSFDIHRYFKLRKGLPRIIREAAMVITAHSTDLAVYGMVCFIFKLQSVLPICVT